MTAVCWTTSKFHEGVAATALPERRVGFSIMVPYIVHGRHRILVSGCSKPTSNCKKSTSKAAGPIELWIGATSYTWTKKLRQRRARTFAGIARCGPLPTEGAQDVPAKSLFRAPKKSSNEYSPFGVVGCWGSYGVSRGGACLKMPRPRARTPAEIGALG